MSSGFNINAFAKDNLDILALHGLRRSRRELESAQGVKIRVDGREIINFCSNDYLGLAGHPEVIRSFKYGIDKFGAGSGASQLVCGHMSAHRLLEEKLAAFTGRARAVVFSSGYMANLAIASSFMDRGSLIAGDRFGHASMVDAALLSRATFKRFQHANTESLDRILKAAGEIKKLVLTDGVFSMDGDIAPLNDYVDICSNRKAWLMVDDAHGFGVLGNTGAGTVEFYNLASKQVPLYMATFGKALGTFGAFVAGDEDVIEYLIQTARTLIYTTAPPPALAVATARSLELLNEESWRRKKLGELIGYFRTCVENFGLPLTPSDTPIQPLVTGESERTVRISEQLLQRGIYVQAIRPPTVPKGTSRLRITLTAAHEKSQIDYLLETLHALL